MKTIKLFARILLSPFVYGMYFIILLAFPGTAALLIGWAPIIYRLVTVKKEDDAFDIKEAFLFWTCIIWFPFFGAYKWIKEGEIAE